MDEINVENVPHFLAVFMKENKLEIKEVAKEINCSIATLKRIIAKKTFATSNMIKQVGIMISIGFEEYKKLTKADKEKISEKIGALGGGVLGFGTITSAIGASGAVVGLSAAGITSGLAAIGATVGGGMLAGILAISIVPVAVGGLGYALTKGVKSIISNNRLKSEEIDPYWEFLKSHN
ncbi:hypothetical protein [Aureivirga marina]|uniref:hypothetical protein n=1 Tax=Aureivirga marina TaxID=1182451 RepID=UPI0018C8EAA6|nr:hypothetical protein [Aureivirga marina]